MSYKLSPANIEKPARQVKHLVSSQMGLCTSVVLKLVQTGYIKLFLQFHSMTLSYKCGQ